MLIIHGCNYPNDLKAHTRSLNSTTDIKTQRNHFKPLSATLIMAVEKYGVNMQGV